jgi:hypothetical protein
MTVQTHHNCFSTLSRDLPSSPHILMHCLYCQASHVVYLFVCLSCCRSAGFIKSLLDVAAAEACPSHLRQLALVLIIQQVRKRYTGMHAAIHSLLLELSFAIMASAESNLQNSGVSFLLCTLMTHCI